MTCRSSSILAVLSSLVVARIAGAQSVNPVKCSPGPLPAEQPFDTAQLGDLVGEYDLVMVVTTRGWSTVPEHRGRLVLWMQDSIHSHRGMFGPLPPSRGLERPIAGSFAAAVSDTDTPEWRRLASNDRDRPGVMWIRGRLRLGDYDVKDGGGDDLVITHFGPNSFRGRWQSDLGIAVLIDTATHRQVPNPGGYFCAYRRAPR